jgi:hypothetical protein
LGSPRPSRLRRPSPRRGRAQHVLDPAVAAASSLASPRPRTVFARRGWRRSARRRRRLHLLVDACVAPSSSLASARPPAVSFECCRDLPGYPPLSAAADTPFAILVSPLRPCSLQRSLAEPLLDLLHLGIASSSPFSVCVAPSYASRAYVSPSATPFSPRRLTRPWILTWHGFIASGIVFFHFASFFLTLLCRLSSIFNEILT